MEVEEIEVLDYSELYKKFGVRFGLKWKEENRGVSNRGRDEDKEVGRKEEMRKEK